jgi:hypothetical protein
VNNRQLLKLKTDTLTESEVAEVLEYISIMESLSELRTQPPLGDELIVKVLSEAMRAAPTEARRVNHQRNT